jgi:hypothetical protein
LKLPVLGIGGKVEDDPDLKRLFDDLEASAPPAMSLESAMAEARPMLVAATTRLLRRHLGGRA